MVGIRDASLLDTFEQVTKSLVLVTERCAMADKKMLRQTSRLQASSMAYC